MAGKKGMKSVRYSLKDKENLAIQIASTNGCIKQAAEALGITRETATRWVNHDPEFQAILEEVRRIWHVEHGAELREVSGKAIRAMSKRLDDDEATAAMPMRDLAFVAGITLDKSIVTDRVAKTGSAGGEGALKEVFGQLKSMFEEQAKKPLIDGEVVEGRLV